MTKEQILLALGNILEADQINTDADDLYDASADRYKKYAKAKKVLNESQSIDKSSKKCYYIL